ncbi:marine proteobacterial sortase target protein [Aliikangiella marina]|uniref:Marine proteobacterial sortase target protein n=1 Tax=Aliikangiella marina TaxID=1712262 RepID=A0A545T7H8_9GAMM|nr:marine proteobacterial sortase target protein [Aliikangiella marina]TQV73184.1 marine proteobacterial sortase target protein [Aliikangiella marina]
MQKKAHFTITTLWFFLLVTFSQFTLAFNPSSSADELSSGTLELIHESEVIQAPLLSTDVNINIVGMMARVIVTQTFENESANWVEGKYLFPLPEKSAVDTLTMKIGERVIVGEIKEKQQAKKIYERAKISGKKASLVEQQRPNVFSNSVANIAPFEKIEVQIHYQQDLTYSAVNGMSIRFPMTMTPRYTPSNIIEENYQDLSQGFAFAPSFFNVVDLPQVSAEKSTHRVNINVALDSGLPLAAIKSNTHKIIHQQQSESLHKIKLSGYNIKTDRDFILNWKPIDGASPKAAMFTETMNNDSFVSLMIMPPIGQKAIQQLTREVIFVIDTSGSMAGESIKQAKSALLQGIGSLSSGDYFNVIEFNSSFSRLFQSSVAIDSRSQGKANRFVTGLNANGGTEMYAAMNAALTGHHAPTDLRQVIFLTDGAISNESQLFQLIEDELSDSRLFTVGIGSAPNEFFMKRAARFGRGSYTFIHSVEEAEAMLTELFYKISAPVLSNIKLEWPKGSTVEMWPDRIPDLYAGEPLWLKAKTDVLNGEISISGELADSIWQTKVSLDKGKNQHGVGKLWAREKIATIMNKARHGRLTEKAQQAVTQVALEHQLVSRFTSLVAVDKTPTRIAEALYSRRIQQTRPKGSVAPISYPSTALQFTIPPWMSVILIVLSLFCLLVVKGLKK